MKKKLEAELISIAHRILKLKNRADLDQLQQETLKLYEKISVLRFVEDNFSDVKPTIGYASAEETLEEIYGIEETPAVHANEQETKEEEAREEKKAKAKEAKEDKPQATSEEAQPKTEKPEGDADPEQPVDEYQASEEEKEHTEEETEEEVDEPTEDEPEAEKPQATSDELQADEPQEETHNAQPKTTNSQEEPEVKVQVEKPAEDVKAMEAGAAAVYKKEDDATAEEEEQAIDAEVITIAPDDKAKVEDFGVNFEFAFERTPAPEEPQKQKEITFEDFKDYKEPEFVKKGGDEPQATSQQPQAEEKAKDEARDWRDWEPAKDEPKAEDKPQAASQEPQVPAQEKKPKTENSTGNSRTLSLGLNDRIAFEKYLFGGSAEDLNRVISQLNTFDTFDEAKEFIADMVKPDYNNWQGKEEYEERFLALVEKKFE